MAVADAEHSYTLTGNGDVLEPDDGVIAIGSGGNYRAVGGARADGRRRLSAEEIARRAMRIAGEICVYTNANVIYRDPVTMDVPTFSPREIVSELDRFIVGQNDAKRAVAIALRNRWRRQHLPEEMREEVVPKNILMIGPTGCGKTEIARRLAKLAQAPFLKVEATKFTEVGYVGRDVDSIVRDLVEVSITMLTREQPQGRAGQGRAAGARTASLPPWWARAASADTRGKFRKMLRAGELEDKEVDVSVADTGGPRSGRWTSPACRRAR